MSDDMQNKRNAEHTKYSTKSYSTKILSTNFGKVNVISSGSQINASVPSVFFDYLCVVFGMFSISPKINYSKVTLRIRA